MQTDPLSSIPRSTPVKNIAPVSVFSFLNYREFLSAWAHEHKQKKGVFSGEWFARQAGIKARSLFGMVVRGKRNLSYTTIPLFIQGLGLKGREAKFFEKLVLLNQSQVDEEKLRLLKELHVIKHRGSQQSAVKSEFKRIKDYEDLMHHWYVPALRELVKTSGFRLDFDWIAKKFKFRVTAKQVQESWQVLLRLGLVELKDNRWVTRFEKILIDPKITSIALRKFYKSILSYAAVAVKEDACTTRELGSVVLAVGPGDFFKIKEKFNALRDSIIQDFGNTPQSDDVCLVSFQIIQLTESCLASTKEKTNEENV